MSRKITSVTPENLDAALAYLKRSLAKKSDPFQIPGSGPAELAKIHKLMAELPKHEKDGVLASWLEGVLSDKGRARLLSAMRRKIADSKPGRIKRRALVLPEDTLKEIERLQASTGVPLPRMLYSLAFIANADKRLQSQIVRLAIAVS